MGAGKKKLYISKLIKKKNTIKIFKILEIQCPVKNVGLFRNIDIQKNSVQRVNYIFRNQLEKKKLK